MKAKKLLLSVLSCVAVWSGSAQNIPSHEAYVKPFEGNATAFYDYFRAWTPGTALSEDENFYIARVPMKKRFVNTATQVDPTMTQKRKFCMWTPMGVAETYWQSLPRYVFDGDNFNMWSYVDSQGGWSAPWIRIPGAYSDVTHRNGVANSGGLIFFDSWGGDNKPAENCVKMLVEKDGTGKFKWAEKLIKFMRYYGVDGLGINPEGSVPSSALFQDFISECRKKAEELNWRFHIYWYGTNSNGGGMDLGSTFVSSKQDWLWKNGKQVTDMYMLNYDWTGGASSSTTLAKSLGADPYTLYAGYDIQGNWLARGSWKALKSSELSIVFWGNHTTNMIYQNSSEFGSSDEAVQYCYLGKQEQVFSGGLRNPAKRPAIKDGLNSSNEASMEKFHGIAEYLPARSVLQELPFVTRFGLGNGKFFKSEGKTTFNKKWFNVGVQDYLPTWRWWITDNNDAVPTDAIKCTFNYEDAWYAGSSLKLSGATKTSKIRMFKTNFTIAKGDQISLRYKVNSGTDSHLKLIWSKVGSENTFQSVDIPAAAKQGEWTEFKKAANLLQMNGNVACIGFTVENTNADYEILLGEFSIVNVNKTPKPAKPTIITAENKILKKRTYNALDFKFSWKSAEPNPEDPSLPIYNEDVDTWYFEVYSQAKDGDPVLCGTTSSWAHYVVGAPVSTDNSVSQYRVGVRAIAPDGKTASEMTWTNYIDVPSTPVDGVECDKAVIKSNETFTLSLLDPNQSEPYTWEIVDATSGANIKTQDGGRSLTSAIQKEGYYDIKITKEDLSTLTYRGYVQVSPASTGALPLIDDITASKTDVDLSVSKDPVTLSYTGRKGEGTVSRGLKIEDPYMFRVPADYLPNNQGRYSIGFWVKPEKFSHAQQGINLLNQRDITKNWPNNNWGSIWMHIWPKTFSKKVKPGTQILEDNIVSYTMYENEASIFFDENKNKHEIPNIACCTDGTYYRKESYSLSLNQWSHILISFDGSKQRIYFNGKKVGETTASKVSYSDCAIYFGGSNVYHSGFSGIIDDVQVWDKALSDAEVKESMQGYYQKEAPANLKGYWTFESDTYNEAEKTFDSKGLLNATNKASYLEFKGSAGENSQQTIQVIIPAQINVEGNPALSGSMPITTTTTYSVENAKVVNAGDGASVTFETDGKYNVNLTLENGWGKASKTKEEYIVVVGTPEGVDGSAVENLSVYPNPFVEKINLQFAVDGNYQIDIFDAQGRQVTTKKYQATAGEICSLTIDAAKGMYHVAVSQDGKRIKTFKLISE